LQGAVHHRGSPRPPARARPRRGRPPARAPSRNRPRRATKGEAGTRGSDTNRRRKLVAGRRAAWLAHLSRGQGVARSTPVAPTAPSALAGGAFAPPAGPSLWRLPRPGKAGPPVAWTRARLRPLASR